jgi:hypothetical protein
MPFKVALFSHHKRISKATLNQRLTTKMECVANQMNESRPVPDGSLNPPPRAFSLLSYSLPLAGWVGEGVLL